jgi:hypothetical protein
MLVSSVLYRHLGRSTLFMPLTRGYTVPAATQDVVVHSSMRVDRPYRVLMAVGRFQQLSTPQIKALEFPDASRVPCDRTLQKLVSQKLLELVPSPAGGVRVYQLTTAGQKLLRLDVRRKATAVNYHSLTIADVYIKALEDSRKGLISIDEYETTPDTHFKVAGLEVRPDLFLRLNKSLYYYMEIDLGGESKRALKQKIENYLYAYEHSQSFPVVVFLCNSVQRVRDIKRIVRAFTPPDGVFEVELLENVSRLWVEQ